MEQFTGEDGRVYAQTTPELLEQQCSHDFNQMLERNQCQCYITIEKNYLTGMETPKLNFIHNSKMMKKDVPKSEN